MAAILWFIVYIFALLDLYCWVGADQMAKFPPVP